MDTKTLEIHEEPTQEDMQAAIIRAEGQLVGIPDNELEDVKQMDKANRRVWLTGM